MLSVGSRPAVDVQEKHLADQAPSATDRSVQAKPAETQKKRDTLTTYMREAGRYSLMTATEERRLAEEIAQRRITLWYRLFVGFYPYTSAVATYTCSCLDGDEPLLDAVSMAADAVRALDRKSTRDALDAAAMAAAKRVAALDLECEIINPLVVDIERIGRGERPLLLQVNPPRAGSAPFASYAASVFSESRRLLDARNRFAKANLRLVVRMANRFARSETLPVADLVQEGNLGLLKAVDRFDPSRGFRFSTYATWWIRHAIRRAISDKSKTVRIPVHQQTLAAAALKARRELFSTTGKDPSLDAVAAHIGIAPEKIKEAEAACRMKTKAISRRTDDDGCGQNFDDIPSDAALPDAAVADAQTIKIVLGGLDRLDRMHREIIEHRFGLGGREPQTLASLGEAMGLSRERIRQLQVEAIAVLRSHVERLS